MSADRNRTCKERVGEHYSRRMEVIQRLWALWQKDDETHDEEDGNFNEYGLSWDYIPAGTFEKQRRGYFRWQLSWGGPSDEFRFFVDEQLKVCRIEYWFMDWFDGARRVLRRGRDFDLLCEIWADLLEWGSPQQWMKATQT